MSLGNVKHIILVLSGKGGVGKSSVTTQLALSLCLAGHSVGILDVDLTGPSIPRLLGAESAKVTQAPGGWLPVEVHPAQVLPHLSDPPPIALSTAASNDYSNGASNAPPPAPSAGSSNGASHPPSLPVTIGSLHIMSLGFLLPSRSSAVVWRGPKKTAMVRQFLTDVLWPPDTTYLLIDTPPGTSDEHISLAETLLTSLHSPSFFPASSETGSLQLPKNHQQQQLAGALIVTTPQAVAVSDVRKEINFCRKVGVRILGVVENMAGYVCECCGVSTNVFGKGGGEVMSAEFGVKFLGRVPLDGQWGVLVEEGKRPRYGGAEKIRGWEGANNASSSGLEADPPAEPYLHAYSARTADESNEDYDRLLVDKYRSCALSFAFAVLARDLTAQVAGAETS